MAFPFLQRGSLAEHARQISLASYTPEIALEGLLTGVDNVRTDVFLSPRFSEAARQHIAKLLAKHGSVEDLVVQDSLSFNAPPPPRTTFIGSAPVKPAAAAKTAELPEFKAALTDLLTSSLNRAKAESNVNIDLLARVAVLKFLRSEMTAQYAHTLERCKTKLKGYEGPRTANPHKAMEMRERFAGFQVNKRAVLRKAGQELFTTARDVEKESLAKLRRSLLGDAAAGAYELFLNRLLFTEDGRDDFLNAEHYVMLGNYDRDPDRFQTMLELAIAFLKSLSLVPAGAADEDKLLDAMLSVAENAQELVAGGTPDESTPKGKAQKALLAGWMGFLEGENVFENVLASYEAVPLLAHYSPPINPQQLKNALVSKSERKRVETLLEEQGRLSTEALHASVKKLEGTKGAERAKVAGRFLSDFIRYHRDYRRFEALLSAMDSVNVIQTDKLRELSSINNTLYEFLLTEEQKKGEGNVTCHVILKADIRDSTSLTRTLYERGLNPASFFSLNFFDPVNKLLPKYEATKVFIEGDALILALFERAGEQGFGVSRTCVLAKEMIEIVRAYNAESTKNGLPNLELGLGICYQESAPMYLMDGTHRIMISKALNESDRLSGCSKGVRKFLGSGGDENFFNVYSFQTVEDKDTMGMPDEFLLRYNVGGIHINRLAFEKLRTEISLKEHNIELPMLWEKERVPLYSGIVPLGQGIFHRLVVREGKIAHINADEFALKNWTEKKYYEVVVNETIYEVLEQDGAFGGSQAANA